MIFACLTQGEWTNVQSMNSHFTPCMQLKSMYGWVSCSWPQDKEKWELKSRVATCALWKRNTFAFCTHTNVFQVGVGVQGQIKSGSGVVSWAVWARNRVHGARRWRAKQSQRWHLIPGVHQISSAKRTHETVFWRTLEANVSAVVSLCCQIWLHW